MHTFYRFAAFSILFLGCTLFIQAQQNTICTVGDTVYFMIPAVDEQGDTLQNWNTSGTPVSLLLHNSTANTDTSSQTWNDIPGGYSYATVLYNGTPLVSDSTNQWTLPQNAFKNGIAIVSFVHTKSDTGVYFTIPDLHYVSKHRTFTADEAYSFFIEPTYPHLDVHGFYVERKYEIMVSPRDKYLNITYDQCKVTFEARYPDEFASGPGISDIFSDDVILEGPGLYTFRSTKLRSIDSGQVISVLFDNGQPISSSEPFAIMAHAPDTFSLLLPPDHTCISPTSYRDIFIFAWECAHDPYSNIRVSCITGEIGNDVVTYTNVFRDSTNLVKLITLPSDNNGNDTTLTITHGYIDSLFTNGTGMGYYFVKVLWSVIASDGLFSTYCHTSDTSQPYPGRYLYFQDTEVYNIEQLPGTPTGITLSQNYPNPVTRTYPVTNIRFETTAYAPVTLAVYNMLGEKVATIVNETLAPGAYTADFNTADLPSGVYQHTLHTGGTVITKSMVVSK